jgi:tRNA-modifying protein YgfZ
VREIPKAAASRPMARDYTRQLMTLTALRVGARPRDFVGVRGPAAESYLQAMVSNDVEKLAIGDTCEALLLTPKARVIAPLVVHRRAVDDFLLLTEPGLGERVRATLLRMRFAARCEIELEEHTSAVVLGDAEGIPTADYGVPAVEVLDAGLEPTVDEGELELLRIRAATPRLGREIDDRVLPAEAGFDRRAIDFAKGCYPGQEPVARQHYRGRVNRSLRVLEIEGSELPEYDAELVLDGKAVGRVTSVAPDGDRVVALAYVRAEVPADATLGLGSRSARQLN